MPATRRAARAAKSNGARDPDAGNLTATEANRIAAANPTTLTLEAQCVVSDAATLKESLASLLDEPLAVTLDISALQRIDTAGVQLITAFIRERATRGRAVEWQGSAPVLQSAAQLLGLTSLLGLPA
jgi:ABC-type transporter Mla MlaB component